MVDLNRLRQEAERAIRSAFPDDEAPSPADMGNDHCPECQETAARFIGKRWSALAAGDLLGNPEPGLLTAPGFRYYLPAMMLLSMECAAELDCLPDGVIGVLSPKGTPISVKDAERLRFTRAQAQAIVGFLRFFELRKKLDWSEPDRPDEAILAVPTERPLERAIALWTARASEDAA
jgi:hypothetical protein